MYNLANLLTLFRLALLPLIVLLFYFSGNWAAWTCLVFYIIGAVTDWLDGYVARKFNQITPLGTFLDPIADKIYVAVPLLMLVASERIVGIWVLLVLIILIREFLISGLREYLGPQNIQVPVSRLAKWKTSVQMVATGLLIISPVSTLATVLGLLGLLGAAVLTVITGWGYLKAGLEHIAKIT